LLFGNNWTSLLPTHRSALYKGSLTALYLGLALALRRGERFKDDWAVASALFVAEAANAVSYGLGNRIARRPYDSYLQTL
jgi:hypothetical protein